MGYLDNAGLARVWEKVKAEVAKCLPLTGGTITGGLTIDDQSQLKLPGDAQLVIGNDNVNMWSEADGDLYLGSGTGAEVHVYGIAEPYDDTAAANKKYVDDKATQGYTATLTVSGWSSSLTQNVGLTAVQKDEAAQAIHWTPAIASQDACYAAGVRCTGQSVASLTFTCDTVPTADLTIYITIQEVV